MPWVRIDENAMDHPKIVALPDGAFRLWVQGLAYCQKHLTDGLMPHVAVSRFLAFSPKRQIVLLESGLWERGEKASDLRVHDYLQWNDSREDVTSKRDAAKERMRRSRELRYGERSLENVSPRTSREVLRDVKGSGNLEERGPGKTIDDWFDECQQLHGGKCGGSRKHATRMLLDASKAARA